MTGRGGYLPRNGDMASGKMAGSSLVEKWRPGETPEEALKREILEELETNIVVERLVQTVEWDYPQFHLTMHCYWCSVASGLLTLKEHEAARWLTREQLDSVDWLPADRVVVDRLKQ